MIPNEGTGAPHRAAGRPFLARAAVPLRRWRMIATVAVCTTLAALAAQLLLPPMYAARATLVLAPSPQSAAPAGLGALGGGQLPAALGGLSLGGNTNQRLLAAVVKSRSADAEVTKRVGRVSRRQADVGQDGSINIVVEDRDSLRAARAANEYATVVNELMRKLSLESTRLRQDFLRSQMAQARARLEASEERMVRFQQGSNTVDLQEQAAQTVRAAADLERGVAAQELAVAQLRRSATPDNPQLRAAEAELASRRAQLRRLTGSGDENRLFVSSSRGPELRAATIRMTRDFTEAQTIYSSLASMLAQAQIDGSNNLPVVNVLDPAFVKPAGAPTVVVLAIALIFGTLLGVAIAYVSDYLRQARSEPENREFFETINDLGKRRSATRAG